MESDFYLGWDSKYSCGYRNSASSSITFIIASSGILSAKDMQKLASGKRTLEKYSALDDKNITYYEYYHKDTCPDLQIAGHDFCSFINYVQNDSKCDTIIIVAFSKATIAGYYALTSRHLKRIRNLHFIVGGAPWNGTELCDPEELKKIPCRIPWIVVKIFIKLFLKTSLEKDLSPNSDSIKNIDFVKLNQLITLQFVTQKQGYRCRRLLDVFPDTFVWWVFSGYFADGVIPIQSQKRTHVKQISLPSTHCSALQQMVDICINLFASQI